MCSCLFKIHRILVVTEWSRREEKGYEISHFASREKNFFQFPFLHEEREIFLGDFPSHMKKNHEKMNFYLLKSAKSVIFVKREEIVFSFFFSTITLRRYDLFFVINRDFKVDANTEMFSFYVKSIASFRLVATIWITIDLSCNLSSIESNDFYYSISLFCSWKVFLDAFRLKHFDFISATSLKHVR